jgi:N-acetylglucosamine kinase-like BadF-type ATPase
MSLFLAIDAGGTKTQCLLADDRRVLARAVTGTVKLMRVSEREATERLHAMLAEVADCAGVSLNQITRTCFGLAGLSSPAVGAWARQAILSRVSGELLLCGDEEIALDAAFAGGPGILVVAGTGSNAIGRSTTGESFSAGGWGPLLGDEGSGHWIGLEAIRAALRVQDRIPLRDVSTSLLHEIQSHWQLNSLAELVALANQPASPNYAAPDFASLAPVVARCNEQGNALAADVLQRAGEELGELVALVFRKMTTATLGGRAALRESVDRAATRTDSADSPAYGVAFTGSVLTHITAVRAAMIARVAVLLPAVEVRESAVDSLDGALWRARRD